MPGKKTHRAEPATAIGGPDDPVNPDADNTNSVHNAENNDEDVEAVETVELLDDHPFPENFTKTSLHIIDPDEDPANTEQTYILAVFLSVKAPSSADLKYGNYSFYSGIRSKLNNPKVAKTSPTTGMYRRMYCFGDLSTKGRCFFIIDKTSNDEDIHWKYARRKAVIGDIFAIFETNNIINYIGDSLPIVETSWPFHIVKNPSTLLKTVPIDQTTNQQLFFVIRTLRTYHFSRRFLARQTATEPCVTDNIPTKTTWCVDVSTRARETQVPRTQLKASFVFLPRILSPSFLLNLSVPTVRPKFF